MLDASEVDEVVYVVSEWVSATNLVDLLADGPLPPAEARQLAVDVAEALSAAHRAGLAHLCLQPEHVLRTTHGQVKLGGLAVDAAVRGVAAAGDADAARRDTWGAAAIAYAALTARWPGDEATGLPAAPRDGAARAARGRSGPASRTTWTPCSAARWTSPSPSRTRWRPRTSSSGRSPPCTSPAGSRWCGAGGDDPRTDPSYRPPPLSPYDDQAGRPRSRTALLAWGAVTLVLVVGFALAGGQLVMSALDGSGTPGDDQTQSESNTPPASAPATGTPIRVKQVLSFDPLPDGTGEENGDRAARVVDGDRSTVWTTKSYDDPFGPTGIKDGVGLLLDLGSRTEVGSATVWVAGGSTDLEVLAADQRGRDARRLRPGGQGGRRRRPRRVPSRPSRCRRATCWSGSRRCRSPTGPATAVPISEVTVRE